MSKINEITIISPVRMVFISRIFKKNFEERGITCHIVRSEQFDMNSYNSILLQNPGHYYFIYCLFLLSNINRLPPKRYIIYQLEQHTNNQISRHYQKILPYLSRLYHSAYKVFDYNQQNINVLYEQLKIRPHLLPIPFSCQRNYFTLFENTPKEYDIIFIGLINERRKKILQYLKTFFTIGIPQGTIYGNDLIQYVCKGKILLNIHYYDNAILERPRLNEMIPIGIPIVSEKPNPKDLDIVSLYKNNVHFIDIINENNIQPTLISEIKNCPTNTSIDSMNSIEQHFRQSFQQHF